MNPDLSLIIPCYNEEVILRNSVNRILEALNTARFSYEIILIDDYSVDGTVDVIKQLVEEHPDISIKPIFHKWNEGRGKTVSDGILNSGAEIVGFIDTDLSTSAAYIPALVLEIKKGADVATALRIYKLSWSNLHRWIISKGYRFLVKLLLRLDLNDTETGCKFFNREKITPILDEIHDHLWFWDTEIMVRAYLKGLKIVEVPSVFIRKGLYTRVKIIRDSFRYFVNLIKFKQELNKASKK